MTCRPGFTAGHKSSPLPLASPHGGSRSCLVGDLGGGLPGVATAGRYVSRKLSCDAVLCPPCRRCTRHVFPPPFPYGRLLLLCCQYLQFCAAPLGAFVYTTRLARSTRAVPPPLICCWLPDCVVPSGPVLHAPVPPLSSLPLSLSSLSSSSPPPDCRSSTLLHPRSSPLLLCPHPPPSLGLLQPLAPPRAPLPPAPAADITRKDKDVGYWTGGGEAL